MGQYYKAVNLDKKQYIHPHVFGDGAKLLEFGCSQMGMMTGLAFLLADGNGRGGGDASSTRAIIGSWAGDRIVIAGDYADEGKWGVEDTLYTASGESFQDVSEEVILAMLDETWLREHWQKDDSDWHKDIVKRDAPKAAVALGWLR